MKGPKAVAAIAAALAGISWFVVCVVRDQAGDPLVQGTRAYGRADWRSAEARARSVLKTNSSDPQALRLLARTSARQGRDESAEAIYRRLGTKFMESEDFFLLGRGLFEPVDDFDGSKCSSPAILDWLSYDFMAHDYDIKHTLKVILLSRVYQLPVAKEPPAKRKEAPPLLGPVAGRDHRLGLGEPVGRILGRDGAGDGEREEQKQQAHAESSGVGGSGSR